MKILIVLILSLGSSLSYANLYGESFVKPKGRAATVVEAIADLSASKKKKMRDLAVRGKISSVCQMKGCWVTLKTNDSADADTCKDMVKGAALQQELRIAFKDHSFEVPKDLKGDVMVYGNLEKKKLSSYQLKHLLKDAGCSKSDMKKVKGSMYKYQMTATGLRTL